MRPVLRVLPAAALLLATACAVPAVPTSTEPTSTTPTDSGPNTGNYQFGGTHTSNGLRITVTPPSSLTTSPYAVPEQSAPAWSVDLTIANQRTTPVDTALLIATGYNADRPTTEVFDTGHGLNGLYAAGPVMPGQTVTVRLGYLGTEGGTEHRVTVTETTFTGRGNTATWTA